MENKNKELQIELSPDKVAGVYSNLAVISHGTGEFFMDFISMAPNAPKATVQSRVIMTPENAKNLLFALMDNVKKYEDTFGEIKHIMPVKRTPNDEPNGGGSPISGMTGGIPNPFSNGGKLN